MAGKFATLSQRRPSWLRISYLFHLNFYRIHLSYFIIVILLASVIMYGSTTNGNSGDAEAEFRLRYIDALFLCTSSMTNTGLNTVNLGSITAFQQVVLFLLLPLGNVMVVTASTIYVRKYYFRKKMSELVKHSKAARDVVGAVESQDGAGQNQSSPPASRIPSEHPQTHASLRQRKSAPGTGDKDYYDAHHYRGQGGIPMPWQSRKFRSSFHAPFRAIHRQPHDEDHHYLSFHPALDSKASTILL